MANLLSKISRSAGAGFSSYGEILKEKNRKDWEDKKDEVLYKRQIALTNLAKSNQLEVAGVQHGWNLEDREQQNKFGIGEFDRQQAAREKAAGVEHGYNLSEIGARQSGALALADKEHQYKIDEQEALLEFKVKFDKANASQAAKDQSKIKDDEWNKIVESGAFKKLTPDQLLATEVEFKYGVKMPVKNLKEPTEQNFKSATETLMASKDFEKLSTAEQNIEIRKHALLQANNPQAFSEILGAALGGGAKGKVEKPIGKFEPDVDIPKLTVLAEQASKDPSYKAKLDSVAAKLKAEVGEKEYNRIFDKVNKDVAARQEIGKPKTGSGMYERDYKAAFEAELKQKGMNPKNMTRKAYNLQYENWKKTNK